MSLAVSLLRVIATSNKLPTDPVEGSYGVFLYDPSSNIVSSGMSLGYLSISATHTAKVYKGGIIDSATIWNNATISVGAGGLVSNLKQNNVKEVTYYIASGGRVDSLFVSKASLTNRLYGEGTVNEMTTYSANQFQISGATIRHLIQSTYGGVNIRDNGVISSADVYANHLHVSSGGLVQAATIYNRGHMSVWAGGTALNVLVSSGGEVVDKGGHIE